MPPGEVGEGDFGDGLRREEDDKREPAGQRGGRLNWTEPSQPTVDLLEEERDVIVVERQPSTEHHVEDHSARPNVNLGTSVEPIEWNHYISFFRPGETAQVRDSLSRDDLGGGVIGTPAGRLEKVSIAHDVGESKIGNLDVEVFIKEEAEVGAERPGRSARLFRRGEEDGRGEREGVKLTSRA